MNNQKKIIKPIRFFGCEDMKSNTSFDKDRTEVAKGILDLKFIKLEVSLFKSNK